MSDRAEEQGSLETSAPLTTSRPGPDLDGNAGIDTMDGGDVGGAGAGRRRRKLIKGAHHEQGFGTHLIII